MLKDLANSLTSMGRGANGLVALAGYAPIVLTYLLLEMHECRAATRDSLRGRSLLIVSLVLATAIALAFAVWHSFVLVGAWRAGTLGWTPTLVLLHLLLACVAICILWHWLRE